MLAILLTLLGTAEASADLELQTNLPVVVFVGDERTPLTVKRQRTLEDLEPGVHQVRVESVFGSVLQQTSIELTDDTLTTARWSRGNLEVTGTEATGEAPAVPPAELPTTAQADAPQEADEAVVEDVAVAEDPIVAEDLAVAETAETDASEPVPESPPALEPEVLASAEPVDLPDPESARIGFVPEGLTEGLADPDNEPLPELTPIRELAIPASIPAETQSPASSRRVTLEAKQDWTIAIEHEGRTLLVHVIDGGFVVEDEQGLRMALAD
ncbi:MAG: hypothetical protein KC912_18975 [Proteobacteria bacterium]|nr:hypothetical protein [Pseudomonadota bacterium]